MSKIIGLDVSKKWLDICLYGSNNKPIYNRFSNDKLGHEELIKLIKEQEIKIIVCKPTGGYEAEICRELYNNKQQIYKVNTYSFNLFSKSVNLCKTDKKDAFKLAYYGDEHGIESYRSFIKGIAIFNSVSRTISITSIIEYSPQHFTINEGKS